MNSTSVRIPFTFVFSKFISGDECPEGNRIVISNKRFSFDLVLKPTTSRSVSSESENPIHYKCRRGKGFFFQIACEIEKIKKLSEIYSISITVELIHRSVIPRKVPFLW